MLFFVRSAVCIGAVVAMLPHAEPTPKLGALAQAAGKAATRQVLGLCSASPDCIAAGWSLLQSAASKPPDVQQKVSTGRRPVAGSARAIRTSG